MNERATPDAMFKMFSDKTEGILETKSSEPSTKMAEKAIDRLLADIQEKELFLAPEYKDPIDGLLGELKLIEGPTLVNMVITRYKKNEFDLEAAHHDAVTAAFLIRQKFIEEFISECTLREELRAGRLEQGKNAPDDGFNKAAAEEALMLHLALTLTEFSTDKIDVRSDRYADEIPFKSEIFGMLIDYGIRAPDRLERVFYIVDKVLLAKQRAFVTAVKTDKLKDVDGRNPENINTFIESKGFFRIKLYKNFSEFNATLID
jgi:hypothetical protein